MSMNEQMNHAEENILHTYNRFPVMFDHGEGCCLYDTEGKKYLDFAAGIPDSGVGHAIGYSNEKGIPYKRPFVKYTTHPGQAKCEKATVTIL